MPGVVPRDERPLRHEMRPSQRPRDDIQEFPDQERLAEHPYTEVVEAPRQRRFAHSRRRGGAEHQRDARRGRITVGQRQVLPAGFRPPTNQHLVHDYVGHQVAQPRQVCRLA
jgi:hypothetical protein